MGLVLPDKYFSLYCNELLVLYFFYWTLLEIVLNVCLDSCQYYITKSLNFFFPLETTG